MATTSNGQHYSVWKRNEYKGSAFGTPTGVAEWAAKKWGIGCSLEPLTEKEHDALIRKLREEEETQGYFFRGQ